MSKRVKVKVDQSSTYLSVVRDVLSHEVKDTKLRASLLEKIEASLDLAHRREVFDTFFDEFKLPSLEASDVFEVKRFVSEMFPNDEIKVEPNEKDQTVTVKVDMADGILERTIPVTPPEEKVPKPTFVPFPVCLSGDSGLVWLMGRAETVSEPEARIALNAVSAEFWETKTGLKLQKLNVPKTFASFIERVPTQQLTQRGLKRHYKVPGVLQAVDGEKEKK